MKFNNLINNKWFIFGRYFLAGLTILASIIALLASWYAQGAAFDQQQYHLSISHPTYQKVSMVFGFIGIIASILTLIKYQKAQITFSVVIFSFCLLVTLLVLASFTIIDVEVKTIDL